MNEEWLARGFGAILGRSVQPGEKLPLADVSKLYKRASEYGATEGQELRCSFTIAIDAIGLKGKASEVRVESLADVRAFFSLLSEGDPDGRPRIEARVLQDGRQLFRVTRNGVFVYRFEYAPDA